MTIDSFNHPPANIRSAPLWVEQIEKKLLNAVCGCLSSRQVQLTEVHLQFLCAPWVHFLTHSLLHRLETLGVDLSTPKFPLVERSDVARQVHAPGDTLAFMEFFRTKKYTDYLDLSLAGSMADYSGRTATHTLFVKSHRKATTTAFMPCFPRNFRYLMGWLNLGRIQFLDNKHEAIEIPVNTSRRLSLFDGVKNSFDDLPAATASWLAARVSHLFPKSLLENLEVNLSEKLKLPVNQNLFSADGWHIIDDWKIYALAQKIKANAHWIGAPNAISHGSLAVFWQRHFELAFLDTYLSWGWSHSQGAHATIVPFNAPHYAGKRQASYVPDESRKGVLISSAARPQHLLEYPYLPQRFERYLEKQLLLAQGLNSLLQEDVTIRTRPKDLGWDVKALVDSLKNSAIQLEFQSGQFSDRLKQCRLHVCDNCSTTIVESLWANHPTLVMITDDYFQLYPQALQDYKILADAGIFHDSLESLLAQCKLVQDRPEQWWMSAKTQSAIQNFLRKQGRCGDGLLAWTRALISPTALKQ